MPYDHSATEVEVFSSNLCAQLAMGPTQPPVQWSLPRGNRRPGRDADHSPPSSAEVKKEGLYLISLPQAPFMAYSGSLFVYDHTQAKNVNTVWSANVFFYLPPFIFTHVANFLEHADHAHT
jgi:hypothetical protein